jgi:hypothetical protein
VKRGSQTHASSVARTLNTVWPGCLAATDRVEPGDLTIVALLVCALCLFVLPVPWVLALAAALTAAAVAWRVAQRTPLWYAATIGIPIPQAVLLARVSMADLFMLPSILRDAGRWTRGVLPQSSLVLPLVLLAGISLVATVVGYFRVGHWSMWGILNKDVGLLLQIATVFAITARLRTFEEVRRTAQWYVIGVSASNIGMLLAVVMRLFGVANPIYRARLFGWMSQPTITGGLLLVAVMLELGALTAAPKSGERRALRWANLWLLGLSLGLTVSRSAWLGVVAGSAVLLAVLWIRDRKLMPRPRFSHVGVTLVWMVAPGLFLGNVLIANLMAGVPLISADRRDDLRAELVARCRAQPELDYCVGPIAASPESRRSTPAAVAPGSQPVAPPPAMPDVVMNARGLNDRAAILRAGWQQYTRDWPSMVLGIGLGTFYETSVQEFGLPLIIHNTFAWYLFEFGPIAFAILLWIWVRTAHNIWIATKQREDSASLALGLMAALGAFAVFCLFNEGFYQRQFWLVMVLADRLAAQSTVRVDPTVSAAA